MKIQTKQFGELEFNEDFTMGWGWYNFRDDAFIEGNDLGMAVGQPVFATKLEDGSTPRDGNYVWEWWYRFQVTDNISVTPSLFYLSRPGGQYTPSGKDLDVFGALVQTQFKF